MKASYQVRKVTPEKVFIIDRDIGMSITNDAEAVVGRVNSEHPGKRIIYCDTDGRWDELAHEDGNFTGFKPYSEDFP